MTVTDIKLTLDHDDKTRNTQNQVYVVCTLKKTVQTVNIMLCKKKTTFILAT